MEKPIWHDEKRRRFAGLTVDGDEFFLEYRVQQQNVLDAHRVYVPPSGRGQKLAEKVTRAFYSFANTAGYKVFPSCPYISKTFLRKFPKFRKFTPNNNKLVYRQETPLSACVEIDVVSDTMCPWCFIGKRRLDSAIRQLPGGTTVQTRFHPWLLRPDMALHKQKTMNKKISYLKMFGGNEQKFLKMVAKLNMLGKEEGLGDINFNDFKGNIGTTIDAAQLIYWAGAEHDLLLQRHLVDRLFFAYHQAGKNVALTEVLLECVSGVRGLCTKEAEKVLQENRYEKAVSASILHSREKLEVTGVPYFVISAVHGATRRTFAFPGAQDTEYFVKTIKTLISLAMKEEMAKSCNGGNL